MLQCTSIKEAGKVAYKPNWFIRIKQGRHKLEVEVYNTGANQVVGPEKQKKKYSKRFAHMAATTENGQIRLLGRVTTIRQIRSMRTFLMLGN